MPDSWEARITRITVADDQSQMFEAIFMQHTDFEPDLQLLIGWYGPSLHNPPPSAMVAGMMMPMPGMLPQVNAAPPRMLPPAPPNAGPKLS